MADIDIALANARTAITRVTHELALAPELTDNNITDVVNLTALALTNHAQVTLDLMDEVMRDPKMAAAVGLDGAVVATLWQAYQDGAPGMYWSRVWALYVLIRWCHRHGVLL